MKLDKPTQRARILARFKRKRTLTTRDMMRATWATRPAARIQELREEGYDIERAKMRDRYGFQPYTFKGDRRQRSNG